MPETVEERIEKLDNLLDEYEGRIGLSKYNENYSKSEEVGEYLSYSRDQLEALSPQDLGGIAYILLQYSIFIQRSLNREVAKIKWAESMMKEIVADKLNNYSGYSYAEKYGKAIKDNDYTIKLNSLQRAAQQRSDRLQFLANGIKGLADVLQNLMRVRRDG